jgi:hypothetical protein
MKPLYPLKTSVSLLIFTLFFLKASAQDMCGFDQRHQQLLKFDPEYKKAVTDAEKNIKDLLANKDFAKTHAEVYRIPVVVHVIHNGEPVGTGNNISDAQVQSAITSLTQFYRASLGSSVDAEVEFQLATLDPNCNPTTGINRIDGSAIPNYSTAGLTTGGGGNELTVKNLSRWNYNYYNIWVVSEIDGNDGGGGIQGFAYFPGASRNFDGTVILASSFGYDPGGALGYGLKSYTNLNMTLVHEMGHAFNLYHTFQGDDPDNDNITTCPSNVTCTTDGDRVCDTDPHIRSNSDCVNGTNACSGGNPNANFIHNYMDYSAEACKNNFTAGQVSRMRAAILANRPSLINSMGLNTVSPLSPYTPPIAADFTPATLDLTGIYAGVLNLTVNGRTVTTESAYYDNGYVNGVSNCTNLIQLVSGATYSFSSTILGFNNEQFGLWIDFNNDGDFDDASEEIVRQTNIPGTGTSQRVTINGTITVPSWVPLNTPVRLRVMDDVSTIYGAAPLLSSADSEAGQAEDYPVFFTSLLPMVWEQFTGQLNTTGITLNWNVSELKNSKGFEVQRAYDGTKFTTIGFVPNKGTAYSFKDLELPEENNYYRLKQIDLNDSYEYSKTVLIKSPVNTNAGIKVLKNPFTGYIDVAFKNSNAGKVEISLIDITGKTVFKKTDNIAGTSRKRIDLSGHAINPGVYILEIRTNNQKFVERLLKQ